MALWQPHSNFHTQSPKDHGAYKCFTIPIMSGGGKPLRSVSIRWLSRSVSASNGSSQQQRRTGASILILEAVDLPGTVHVICILVSVHRKASYAEDIQFALHPRAQNCKLASIRRSRTQFPYCSTCFQQHWFVISLLSFSCVRIDLEKY